MMFSGFTLRRLSSFDTSTNAPGSTQLPRAFIENVRHSSAESALKKNDAKCDFYIVEWLWLRKPCMHHSIMLHASSQSCVEGI